MGLSFDPASVEVSDNCKFPETPIDNNLDDALAEIDPIIEELTEDISGIGPKAAKRYLLRSEYGYTVKEMSDVFGVTPQTVSNQVKSVREQIAKYPRLARIIGTLRAQRADLHRPDLKDGATSEGSFDVLGDSVDYLLTYKKGNVGRPFSWQYDITSTYQIDDCQYHLNTAYIVDAIYGVLLKRTHLSVSLISWSQPSRMYKYDYEIYPLPNAEVPTTDGTLLEATELHTAYDIKTILGALIEGIRDWDDLVGMTKRKQAHHDSPSLARKEVLINRIRQCQNGSPVEDYTEAVHIRRNLERIMRNYPMLSPWDLPYETITEIWDGYPADNEDHTKLWLLDKQYFYAITADIESRHKHRDYYPYSRDIPNRTSIW